MRKVKGKSKEKKRRRNKEKPLPAQRETAARPHIPNPVDDLMAGPQHLGGIPDYTFHDI